MPGSLSFGLHKTLDVSTIITDLPTYKVLNTIAPIFDLTTMVVIGSLSGQKKILLDNSGDVLTAIYSYSVTFVPATNVKGIMSFNFAYNADQLKAGGETEVIGTFIGPIDAAVSSGVFLNQNGTATKVKDSSDVRKYYIVYPSSHHN